MVLKANLIFFSMLFGTAAIMFLTQRIEYAGYEHVAGVLAYAVVLGTLTLTILAVRLFGRTAGLNLLLATGSMASLPFLVVRLLTINGTPLNVHGLAMLGWIAYGFGSEACAIGLLIAATVRLVRSKRHRAS